MELLIIKSADKYIRVKDGQYLLTGLDKASVFPLAELATVKQHAQAAEASGLSAIKLKKLILTEEDFQE